jgi:predicted transcriptional regulator
MPESRETLKSIEDQDISVQSDTHKTAVLALLARYPDQGFEPKEIAVETSVPKQSVYPVLQRLLEENLIVKLSGHYLVEEDRIGKIKDMVLTARGLNVAADISNRNTAPETVDAPDPDNLNTPSMNMSQD